MDLMSGLAAASQAIQIAKDLRGIDRSIDDAGYKLALADLTEKLADTKIALSQAKELIAERDEQIRELKAKLKAHESGDQCPSCRTGAMRVIRKVPYPIGMAAKNGVQNWTTRCDNDACGHEDIHIHDPNNILGRR